MSKTKQPRPMRSNDLLSAIVVASCKIANIPKGSIGTVVHAYEGKDVYEVEFIVNDSPVVETVSIDQITAPNEKQ
jgi:hypothetical protein